MGWRMASRVRRCSWRSRNGIMTATRWRAIHDRGAQLPPRLNSVCSSSNSPNCGAWNVTFTRPTGTHRITSHMIQTHARWQHRDQDSFQKEMEIRRILRSETSQRVGESTSTRLIIDFVLALTSHYRRYNCSICRYIVARKWETANQ